MLELLLYNKPTAVRVLYADLSNVWLHCNDWFSADQGNVCEKQPGITKLIVLYLNEIALLPVPKFEGQVTTDGYIVLWRL